MLDRKQKRLEMLENLENFSSAVMIQSLIRSKLSKRRVKEMKLKLLKNNNTNKSRSPKSSPKVPKLELNTINSNNNIEDGKLSSPLLPKKSLESPRTKRKETINSPLDLEERMKAEMNRKGIKTSKDNSPRSGNTTPTNANRTSILKSPRREKFRLVAS